MAWAIETRDRDGERWLRSTKEERENFFRPAKLRQTAEGKFRGRTTDITASLVGILFPEQAPCSMVKSRRANCSFQIFSAT